MEVHTTHEIVCNGILYTNIANIKSPNNLLCFVNNSRKERLKINNKLYDINTNSYKNLTSNKRFDIVGLYDSFENYVLSKNKKIIRNYLKKGIVFKFEKRIIEVLIKQDELTIVFLKSIKGYDTNKLLYDRKGYEHTALSLALDVKDNKTLDYAKKLFDKEYELLTNDEEKVSINKLEHELYTRIKRINSSITGLKTKKGIVLKGKRNFCILEKRKYGIHVRLLPVEDKDNILKDVGRGCYETMSKYFNVEKKEDIKLIIPYLEIAYEMTKYPPQDIKDGIMPPYTK